MKELILRAKSGDEGAFNELMLRYEKRVYRTAYQMVGDHEDARDITQEAFIKVFKYLGGFQAERRFESWLFRLTVNAAYSFLAKRSPGTVESIEEKEYVDQSPGVEEQVGARELHRHLLTLLDKLSPRERAVFVLRDIQEFSTKEVAKILEITQVTVRRHSNLARARLKSELLEENLKNREKH